ncbi:hypothetical protein pclt_cds_159 [Pandoravirus celtis]|uniref:Uncharacterized protein n=1 Tax=Pandoravirus celtis TaxID=2568002 RepID=A0A4D6EGA6_9VIRU|nr:hypothetical protein pclt_cds_159 [Pandoravirus celtis]
MSLLYRLAVWELGQEPHLFVARTQAEIRRETARQKTMASQGMPMPRADCDRLRQTEELVAIVQRNSIPKEKTD